MSRRFPLLLVALLGACILPMAPARASDDATRAVAAAYSEQIMDGLRIGMTMAPDTPASVQECAAALDDHAAYSASKAGLNMLTKAMSVEWAKHNVQSNSICPTVILTPMGEMVWGDPAKGDPMKAKIPAGRFGRTTEVADLILFLASPASDMICGQVILLDGGFTAQ